MVTLRVHGGPDVQGVARWDFSSNANACGPCPSALQAVASADAMHYPDPAYTALRCALATHHAVEPWRVVLAASASEFIQRMTAWCWREGGRHCWTPPHAYGDYAHAACAWGMEGAESVEAADLVWLCEPGSPLGQAEPPAVVHALPTQSTCTVVLDCAYEPLRLRGVSSFDTDVRDRLWQLWSPNKALGLTGVRAAYAIAPRGAQAAVTTLEALAPSWPVGAHGQAMLLAWTQAQPQDWVRASRPCLSAWATVLRDRLTRLGWVCLESDAPYFCARPPVPLDVPDLWRHGIRLRDATSFGLPGWWRLSAQPPEAQQSLENALLQQTVREESKT